MTENKVAFNIHMYSKYITSTTCTINNLFYYCTLL